MMINEEENLKLKILLAKAVKINKQLVEDQKNILSDFKNFTNKATQMNNAWARFMYWLIAILAPVSFILGVLFGYFTWG